MQNGLSLLICELLFSAGSMDLTPKIVNAARSYMLEPIVRRMVGRNDILGDLMTGYFNTTKEEIPRSFLK